MGLRCLLDLRSTRAVSPSSIWGHDACSSAYVVIPPSFASDREIDARKSGDVASGRPDATTTGSSSLLASHRAPAFGRLLLSPRLRLVAIFIGCELGWSGVISRVAIAVSAAIVPFLVLFSDSVFVVSLRVASSVRKANDPVIDRRLSSLATVRAPVGLAGAHVRMSIMVKTAYALLGPTADHWSSVQSGHMASDAPPEAHVELVRAVALDCAEQLDRLRGSW